MSAGLNYPDSLYADHLAKQTPIGAYRSTDAAGDAVNHPPHYQRAGIETIDYIRASLGEGFGPYCVGNVLKYVSRYRDKGGVEDLRKAQVYLGWAIDANQPTGCNAAIQPVSGIRGDVAYLKTGPDSAPKWHVSWGKPKRDELPLNLTAAVSTPNAIPVESSYLDSFSPNGSRIATADEIADMRSVLSAEELKGFGIGDVPHESSNVTVSRHPMQAAALQDADEYNRGTGDTGV
jgi:hypothetical protein